MSNPLGDFLRARRTDARLQTEASRSGARRRTSGLRREEVATAAGISADYYTRLEQGRETHPSDAVLDALARALRLDPDAADHLHRLRDAHPGMLRPETVETPALDDALVARMTMLVDAVRPNPAYVLDRLSTVVAANPEGLALHEGLADLPPAQRNTCRSLLLDPRATSTFVEWEELARGAVAHLRAANVDDLRDPQLVALVEELSAQSPLFRTWWGGHLVQRRRGAVTHVRSADGTVAARRYEVLHLPEDGMRMTLWLPAL
ncbi:helix-turn-helix transcriptional regulator [Microbacterium sp. 2MCAF23]|uniref:helix-turn-helix transcriptional regulator n=1 Tax=Microbacterium sp. 2MCAF23 TaxID=3232985 RepID=UPI003F97474C